MDITKNSVVFYRYEDITDYGVISRIVDEDGFQQHWSAWRDYYEDTHCELESLTLIGPPILGVFNDEGN